MRRGGGLQDNHRGCLAANIQLWGPMGEGGGGCKTTTGAASVLTYSCGGPWVRGGLQHNHRGCLGANIQLWGPWVRGGLQHSHRGCLGANIQLWGPMGERGAATQPQGLPRC